MGGTEAQRAWVTRVLGRDPWSPPAALRMDASVRVAAPLPAAEADAATPPQPFQIFVKSLDEVTLTFRLPNGSATTLGELRGMIERRTGISLNEHRLQFRTKEFNAAHASLAIAEYDVHPDQTLTLLGRLQGGFGERAAAADVILRGIRAGNVVSDIVATGGESRARAAFGRYMLQEDKRRGMEKEAALFQNFKAALFKKLASDKLLPDGVASEPKLEAWMKDNMTFLSAIACSNLQAGTCADYANLVYTSLISNTKNQSVYRAGMNAPYDHAFVITSPTDHGDDVEKLYNDPDAMVVDAWQENTICSFKEFADGENPYGKLDRKHLAVRRHQTATGKPPLSKEFETAMNSVIDEFFKEASNQDWLTKRTEKFNQNADDIVAAEQQVSACEHGVSAFEKLLEDDKDRPQFKLLWEQKLDDAKRDLAAAQQALADAKGPLLFGSAGEPWERDTLIDLRTNVEILRAFDQAFKNGGFKQLEAEMEELTDTELLSVCKQMKQADNAKFKKYLFGVKQALWLRYSKLDAAEKAKARQAQAAQAQVQQAPAQQAQMPQAQAWQAQRQQAQVPRAQGQPAQVQQAQAV